MSLMTMGGMGPLSGMQMMGNMGGGSMMVMHSSSFSSDGRTVHSSTTQARMGPGGVAEIQRQVDAAHAFASAGNRRGTWAGTHASFHPYPHTCEHACMLCAHMQRLSHVRTQPTRTGAHIHAQVHIRMHEFVFLHEYGYISSRKKHAFNHIQYHTHTPHTCMHACSRTRMGTYIHARSMRLFNLFTRTHKHTDLKTHTHTCADMCQCAFGVEISVNMLVCSVVHVYAHKMLAQIRTQTALRAHAHTHTYFHRYELSTCDVIVFQNGFDVPQCAFRHVRVHETREIVIPYERVCMNAYALEFLFSRTYKLIHTLTDEFRQ
jgi:hypothetical protein